MASTDERTHRPSAKRLRDARKRGQVARSRDLSTAVGLVAATAVLAFRGPMLMAQLTTLIADALGGLDAAARAEVTPEALVGLVLSSGAALALATGPIALAAGAGSVGMALAQGGLVLSTEALQFDVSRLSPVNGLKRLAPSKSGLDTLRAIVGVVVLVVIAWRLGLELTTDAPRLVGASTPVTLSRTWDVLVRFLWQAGLALLVLGAIDYALQRYRLMSSLKMTRQEVEDEAKSQEGRPEVKARVRRVQREMSRRRMLKAAARATVIITNPTHYAVALEYNREKAAAPIVLAKGRDLLAARIREIARTHEVPIVENPSLARALYAGAEVGDMIPAPLFGAVAEVLAYLVRIRQLML